MELKFLGQKAGKLSMQIPPKAVWAKASGKSSISPRCLSRNTNTNTNTSRTRTTQPNNMMCTKGGVAEFQPGDGHMRDGYYGWVDFYFQLYDDIFDDVRTGGLVTVVAFSNGTRSSTLDLPSPQLCSSITASSIRKRPECRFGQ